MNILKLSSTVVLVCILVFTTIARDKKILVVTTSADNMLNKPNDHTWGCYTPEVIVFCTTLYDAGIKMEDIDIVSPKGGKVPLAVRAKYPKQYPQTERSALETKLNNSKQPSEVNPQNMT